MDAIERNMVLAELKGDLTPRGVVYQGRPHLRREAAFCLLRALPMDRLAGYCRRLQTDVADLTARLEASRIITVSRQKPNPPKTDGGGVLF